MAWITPKTNWLPADGVATTDYNRIEGNTLSNHRRFEMSSACTAIGNLGGTSSYSEQLISLALADGETLKLKVARYYLHNAGLKLQLICWTAGTGLITAWTSASHQGVEDLNITIVAAAGGAVTGYIGVAVNNPTGGPIEVKNYDGWSLTIEIE